MIVVVWEAVASLVSAIYRAVVGETSIITIRRTARPLMSDDDLAAAEKQLGWKQRRAYGGALLVLLIGQIIVADVFVFLYAARGREWDIPNEVMQTWLGATVVQLIGLVWVVVAHLFPRGGRAAAAVAAAEQAAAEAEAAAAAPPAPAQP